MRRFAGVPYRSERRRNPAVLRAARCTAINDDPSFWGIAHEWSCNEKDRLLRLLDEAKTTLERGIETPYVRGLFADEEHGIDHRERLNAWLDSYIQFLKSEFSYNEYLDRVRKDQLGSVVALDGFIPTVSGRPDGEYSLDVILGRLVGRPGLRRELGLD